MDLAVCSDASSRVVIEYAKFGNDFNYYFCCMNAVDVFQSRRCKQHFDIFRSGIYLTL